MKWYEKDKNKKSESMVISIKWEKREDIEFRSRVRRRLSGREKEREGVIERAREGKMIGREPERGK